MLSPPGDPFVTNTEREIIILLCVLMAWGSVHKHIGRSRFVIKLYFLTGGQAWELNLLV